MTVICIRIPHAISGKGRPRVARNGHVYTPEKTRVEEREIGLLAKVAMAGKPPLTGPIQVSMRCVYTPPKSWALIKRAAAKWAMARSDLDNRIKVYDALNKIVWDDDHQIVWISAISVYSMTEPEHVGITVRDLEDFMPYEV